MIVGEDILELNYELSKDRNYFQGYKARVAAVEQATNDIRKLLSKGYSIDDVAIIVNVSKLSRHFTTYLIILEYFF